MSRLLLIPIFFILGACSSPDPYRPTSPGNLYQCDHGAQMILSLGHQAEHAAFFHDGRDVYLRKTTTTSKGAAFTNDIYTLYHNGKSGQGALAVIERDGLPYLTNCRPL